MLVLRLIKFGFEIDNVGIDIGNVGVKIGNVDVEIFNDCVEIANVCFEIANVENDLMCVYVNKYLLMNIFLTCPITIRTTFILQFDLHMPYRSQYNYVEGTG